MASKKGSQLPVASTVDDNDSVIIVTGTTPTTKRATKAALLAGMASDAELTTGLATKANTVHTQSASTISDFDAEVANNIEVAANTANRHSHSNKALLDTYTQSNANLADAVTKKHAHANQAVLDATTASFLTADEAKLDGIAAGATANDTDANLKSRANHTGTQAQSTIVSLVTDLAAKAPLTSPAFTGTPTGITKSHVGLGNVDNTSDANKPISIATQAVLDNKQAKMSVTVGPTGSGATYECDGTADNVEIKAALDAVDLLGGGVVTLLPGTFNLSSAITMATSGHYSNITVRGSGKNVSILKAQANVAMMTFGNGDPDLEIIPKNVVIEGLTFDLNNKVNPTYGLILTTNGATIRDCVFKNRADGAKNMLYLGVSQNASLDFSVANYLVENCDFVNSVGGFENVLVAQTNNVKFVGCTFGTKSSGYNFLNYGSYNVSLIGCHFQDTGNGVNAHGDTKFLGCDFLRASITVQGDNTLIDSCKFEGGDGSVANVNFRGYIQSGGEALLEAPAADTDVQLKNGIIVNSYFKNSNPTGISAGVFTGFGGSDVLSVKNLHIENCIFDTAEWQGMDVKADYLVVCGCEAKNSGQLGTSAVKFNYVFGGRRVLFSNNRSYDDQDAPTTTTDFFIDDQYNADALASQDVVLINNNFSIGASSGTLPRFWTGSTFTSTKPSGLTLRGSNNDKINPNNLYVGGNVTGSVTFSRLNGNLLTATLIGNITVTAADGQLIGDEWTWQLIQDGTGSRTITVPSSFKPAGGSFTLSTIASSVDSIKWYWDGSYWREVSRSMGVASSANVAGAASTTDNAITRFDGTTGKIIQNSVATITDTGGIATTIANMGNVTGLTVNQNDATNNPRAVQINNSTTGLSLDIQNTANSPGMQVVNNTGTTGGGNNVLGYYTGSTSATTGAAFNMIWNSASFAGIAGYGVVNIRQLHTSATGNVLVIEQKGTGKAIFLNNDSNGRSIDLDQDGNSASAIAGLWVNVANAGAGAAYAAIFEAGSVGIGNTTPNSILQVAGPIATALATKTTSYTITATDSVILADATSAAFTITLPTAVGCTGRQYTIKKIDSSSNVIVVGTTSSQTVDGATSVSLGTQYQSITVVSNGSSWFVL